MISNNLFSLKGKTALVTGGSTGIGLMATVGLQTTCIIDMAPPVADAHSTTDITPSMFVKVTCLLPAY